MHLVIFLTRAFPPPPRVLRRQPCRTGATAAAPPTVTTAGRWTYTGEIMISKVFPAGFGWQFSSGVAEEIGFGADTAGFALTTGIGDAAGVFLGHTLYKAAQSLVSDKVVSGREGGAMYMSLQELNIVDAKKRPTKKSCTSPAGPGGDLRSRQPPTRGS